MNDFKLTPKKIGDFIGYAVLWALVIFGFLAVFSEIWSY